MIVRGKPIVSERAKTNSKLAETDKEDALYWIGYWDGQESILNQEKES